VSELPDVEDLFPYRAKVNIVVNNNYTHQPFLEIQDLFVIRRVQLVLLLSDPFVDHLVHLWSNVGLGDDCRTQGYLRLQLFNLGAGFRKFAVPFP
jgi:hypothetical protein